MPLLRTQHDRRTRAALIQRLRRIRPDTPRRWGRMTPHQMVCHLGDVYRAALGELEVVPVPARVPRGVMRFVALNVPVRWPRGLPTLDSFDQQRNGTRPGELDGDVEAVIERIERLSDPDTVPAPHPILGSMNRAEWGRWGFRHTDHHLRQFNL